MSYADECLERASKASKGPWVVDKDEMIVAPKVKTYSRSDEDYFRTSYSYD